ncbi:FRG domain-containing protein [Dickeya fangzhongdai]|uniref:FRG domain-containing protein n=1 Tax=Dickeya fangzhongdai TaxID=1778540 RepID=UPI001EFA8A71|nr:FRG domain-containing protein [Dickeya fangzhongdai]ULR32818.1 FRG domain-containing protein [Dickeya fangzhongdai]
MKSENEKKDVPIKSVADFISTVMKLNKDDKKPTAYRGQRDKTWQFFPKIFRVDGLYEDEYAISRDVIIPHSEEFRDDPCMFDRLVRMQHFGVPTRLLDVTTNPLVALWFATEETPKKEIEEKGEVDAKVSAFFIQNERGKYFDSDTVSCMANIANLKVEEKRKLFTLVEKALSLEDFNEEDVVKKLCYFIGMEKSNFEKKINPKDLLFPLYVKPKLNNKRIIAQSGAFFIYGVREITDERRNNPIRAEHLTIDYSSKRKVRDELNSLGINEGVLFPELDRTAKIIAERYKIEL